ncbi:MAG TPA: Uma2 family endonuclease [Methylococcus sp.]|nr:Uma2 family endonuclease [Methylococcus sp.]
MRTLKNPSERFTYGDYRHWPEEERWELIDGEAYDISPAPSRTHQQWVLALARQIAEFLDDKPCDIYVAPFDVRLPEGNEADDAVQTVVQPDISVICDPSKLDEAGCRGAPDFIIEVLSPATSSKDQTIKKKLYERHGVQEYWLVHPTDRVLTRYFLEDGHYSPALIEAISGTTEVRILPGLAIDWSFAEPESEPVRHPPR